MTAEDHIVAWIGSSRPHYDELLALEKSRKSAPDRNLWLRRRRSIMLVHAALSLVTRAYGDMLACGDASSDDLYSPAELLRTAILLTEWELEQ